MKVTPIYDGFGAEISDVDLRKPIPDNTFETLHTAIDEAGVVMFRDQVLSDIDLVEFSQRLGPLEQPLKRDQYGGVHEKVTMLANVNDDGSLIKLSDKHGIYMKGNLLWHSDSSFKPVPCTYSVLSAKAVPPEGGQTEFADLRACYDDWEGPYGDIEKEELEDLICEHSIIYSRSLISGDIFSEQEKKEMAPVRQPLVRAHPRTGRKVYYVGSHCSHVEGWPLEKGRALVRELSGFCVRPDHIYSHRWSPNDLVIWDNRSVLHRGRTYDPTQRRIMHRTTVGGDGPLL